MLFFFSSLRHLQLMFVVCGHTVRVQDRFCVRIDQKLNTPFSCFLYVDLVTLWVNLPRGGESFTYTYSVFSITCNRFYFRKKDVALNTTAIRFGSKAYLLFRCGQSTWLFWLGALPNFIKYFNCLHRDRNLNAAAYLNRAGRCKNEAGCWRAV